MTPTFSPRPEAPIEWDVFSNAFHLHSFPDGGAPNPLRTDPLALSKARFQVVDIRGYNNQTSLHIWQPAVSWDDNNIGSELVDKILSVTWRGPLLASSPAKNQPSWIFERSLLFLGGKKYIPDSQFFVKSLAWVKLKAWLC